jgi:hypothetical protein
MATYITLVNQLLRRLNEVPLDIGGDGFDSVRNVQALAKDAINNATNLIYQDGQELPFLKTTYVQSLVAGTNTYDFPADYSNADWESFYLKKTIDINTSPKILPVITYEEYLRVHRPLDDQGSALGRGSPNYIYQTFETKFGVTPLPNDAFEVEYIYWTFPADMSVYTDVCPIPDRFNHVIIDGAMMYIMRFRSNDQSAATHQSNFEKGIKVMRRMLLDDPLNIKDTMIIRGSHSFTSNSRVF